MPEQSAELTQLLHRHRDGDPDAFAQLLEEVYPTLKRIAGRQLRGVGGGKTLDTTALVNEAYLKLVDHADRTWENRAHFFAVTARAMRQILIDYARRRTRQKRGGGAEVLPLDEGKVAVEREAERLIAINEALERLGKDDPKLMEVVECRFFAGLTVEETAEALDISTRSVERHWADAKKALRAELGG